MYKSGKVWVVAGITAVSLLASNAQTAHADETNVTAQTSLTTSTVPTTSSNSTSVIAISNFTVNNQGDNTVKSTESNDATNQANSVDNQAKNSTGSMSEVNTSKASSATNELQSTEPNSNSTANSNTAIADTSVTNNKEDNSTNVQTMTEVYTGGHWYLKDQNDNYLNGWQKLSGNRLVYYDLKNNQMLYGEQQINNNWFYFRTDDGDVVKGWYKLPDGRQVYYDVNPNGGGNGMLHGVATVKDAVYYFNQWTGAQELSLIHI